MHAIHLAAQIISCLRKNCEHRTRNSWVTWRETTERIFEFDIDVSKIKYYINYGKGVSSKINSNNDVVELLKIQDRATVLETIKLVDLYLELEKLKKEQLAYEINNRSWLAIKKEFDVSEDEQKSIIKHVGKWIDAFQENKFHIELAIPASLLVITLDYFLRWVTLWAFTSDQLKDLIGKQENITEGLLVINIILICPVIILFGVFRDKWIEKKSARIFKDLGIEKVKLKIQNTPWNFMLLALYVFSGIFIMSSINLYGAPLLFHSLMGAAYGFYLLLLLRLFSKRVPSPQFVLNQLEVIEQKGIKQELTSEENDEEIVDMEVGLHSANERMEAFVLEAALFGALAFSGFLQIISSTDSSIEMMEKFTQSMINILSSVVRFDFAGSGPSIAFVMSKVGLLSLMCYEALFCSVFFLAVIASRLRFNDLTDSVDRALRLSKSYNKKEEDLIQNRQLSESDSFVKKFNQKIREQLRLGYLSQMQIDPIMEYMKFFRTLGIGTFFVIIITGGLFISVQLSLVLIFVSLVSMFYFRLDRVGMFIQSIGISVQEFYFRAEKYVQIASWGLIITGFFMRTFHIFLGSQVIVSGFTILFLHYLFSLFLPIELHEHIKTKEKGVRFSSDFQQILQKIFHLGLAFFFLGFMLKAMYLPGASGFQVAGLLMLSFFFFFVKKLPHGPKWLDMLLTLCLGSIFIGILCKVQHWPGAHYGVYVFTVLMPILSGIVFYYRKQVRPMLQRAVYILTFFSIAMWSQYFSIGVIHLSFNKTAIERDLKIGYFKHVLMGETYGFDGYDNPQTKEEEDSLRVNVRRLTQLLIQLSAENKNLLNEMAWDVYVHSNDTITLNEAVKWSEMSLVVDRNWEKLDTYTCLLYKLGRYDEAEKAALETISKGKANRDGAVAETEKMLEKIRAAIVMPVSDSLQTDSVSTEVAVK